MRKVCFVIPALTGGGAERVMLHILKNIDRTRFMPSLVVFEKKGEMLFDLPTDIDLSVLKSRRSRYGLQYLIFIKFARLIRKKLPDVIVSFMWYTNVVVVVGRALSGVQCPIAVSERYGFGPSYEGRLVELLRRLAVRFLYPRAGMIITNSRKMGRQLKGMSNVADEKIVTIYNPVDICSMEEKAEEGGDHPWCGSPVPVITAVGRLTTQKGFEYLIRAVRLLMSDGVECRLMIMGTGVEETNLRKLVADLNLTDRVVFLGFQKNPYKYLARATVFVLSSLYEGFPNALLEAQVLGVPCVATRCPTGPDEIITDGVNGLLVPPADDEALAGAIRRLLGDKELRDKFSEAGKKKAEQFRVEKIVKQYENLIEKVCAGSAGR